MKLNSEQQALQDAYRSALDAARANPSNETRATATAASAALSAALPPAKVLGYGSRAGKRQQAERRAMRKGK